MSALSDLRDELRADADRRLAKWHPTPDNQTQAYVLDVTESMKDRTIADRLQAAMDADVAELRRLANLWGSGLSKESMAHFEAYRFSANYLAGALARRGNERAE